MIELGTETLSYKERPTDKNKCLHCIRHDNRTESKHTQRYDPELKRWINICLECGMVTWVEEE